MNPKWSFVLPLLAALSAMPQPVGACGGCFTVSASGAKNAQVVTDHRMVLSLSERRTTLWDQIRYAGSPEDFVWVLPIAPGREVQIGLADNAFMDALDALSVPSIRASAARTCFSPGGAPPSATLDAGSSGVSDYSGYVGAGGCGGGGARSVDYVPGSRGSGNEPNGAERSADVTGRESAMLQPMGAATVGPYAVSLLTASGDGGFDDWMRRNGYDIPSETRQAVEYYRELGFDFLVLRLRPDAGVQQMQPVRVSFDGYLPTLPLRMIAAGVADKVGLSLMVLAPTRVEASNFRNATISDDQITFDFATNRSNYRQLFAAALREGGGSAWVTESASQVSAPEMGAVDAGVARDAGFATDVTDADLFSDVASPLDASALTDADPFADVAPTLDVDAGVDVGSTRLSAATLRDTIFVRRGHELLTVVADNATARRPDSGLGAGDPYVDRRIAFEQLPYSAVLTRLRTELDRVVLDRDLRLEPSDEWLIPQQRVATRFQNVPPCPGGSSSSPPSSSSFTATPRRSSRGCAVSTMRSPGAGMFGLAALALGLRRWRRRRPERG